MTPLVGGAVGGGLVLQGTELLTSGLIEMVGAREELREKATHPAPRKAPERRGAALDSSPGEAPPDPQGCSCGDLHTGHGLGGGIGFSLGGYNF